MTSKTLRLVAGVTVFLAFAGTARAQDDRKAEFALGWSYLHDSDLDDNLPAGGFVSLGGKLTSWLTMLGEVSVNRKSASVGTTDVTATISSFMVGPRLAVTSASPIAPFAQILVGAFHGSIDVGVPNAALTLKDTHFAVQPGAGIDFNFSSGVGVRLEADIRSIRGDSHTDNEGRFAAGLVFRF